MADSTRDAIGEALADKLTPEQLTHLMNEVLAITKKVHADFTCKSCGQKQRQLAEVADAKAVTSSLTDLMTQSWGRPNEQKQDTQIIVNREVYVVADDSPVADNGEPVQ